MAMVVAKSNEGYKGDYGMMADPIGGTKLGGGQLPPLPHAGYGTALIVKELSILNHSSSLETLTILNKINQFLV